MTRSLWLLRHAKSSWDDPGLTDHERPLNSRGVRSCERLLEHLRNRDSAPDLVLCSTSARTRETLGRLLPAWIGSQTILIMPDLYGASAGEIMDVLHRVDAEAASVLVVGHNPGLGEIALHLAGSDESDAARRLAQKFPTGALAAFEVGSPWESLSPDGATLVELVVPRDLG